MKLNKSFFYVSESNGKDRSFHIGGSYFKSLSNKISFLIHIAIVKQPAFYMAYKDVFRLGLVVGKENEFLKKLQVWNFDLSPSLRPHTLEFHNRSLFNLWHKLPDGNNRTKFRLLDSILQDMSMPWKDVWLWHKSCNSYNLHHQYCRPDTDNEWNHECYTKIVMFIPFIKSWSCWNENKQLSLFSYLIYPIEMMIFFVLN